MKFKIMDKEPIYLAGVVHYGALEKSHYSDSNKVKNFKVHMEDGEAYQIDVDELKRNAAKLRNQIKEEVKFHSDHYNNDYKEHRKQWKEEGREHAKATRDSSRKARDNAKEAGADERHKKGNSDNPEMNNFEGAISRFGNVMESLGKHIEKNAHNWEANLKDWSVNFEKNMEGFGDRMETWGEDFGKRMEEWGESFGEQWDKDFDETDKASTIKRYPIYRTYEEIHDKFIKDHPDHIKHQTFYEAQILDTSFENVTAMVMVGGRMSTLDQMRYPVATMTFEPDRWVAVKLTSEEYAKDWLGSLEKVEQLKNYTIEPYFIVRHKKNAPADEIRLFCPISEKMDER